MLQSHIFLTETYVDEEKLCMQIAQNFFFAEKNSNSTWFRLADNLDPLEMLNKNWENLASQEKVRIVNFADKSDFVEHLMQFYQNYPSPSLIFLGNFKNYSTLLQEGMLRLLEEPPHNLFPIVFAHEKSSILPTIQSRCQFHSLPKKLLMSILNQDLLTKVQKKLPSVAEASKLLFQSQKVTLSDLSKVEREEIDFWLWQVQCYLQEFYKHQAVSKNSESLFKVLQARKLNLENLQKKFVLSKIAI